MLRTLVAISVILLCACDGLHSEKNTPPTFSSFHIDQGTTPSLFSDEQGGLISFQQLNHQNTELVVGHIDNTGEIHQQVVASGDDWFVNWADFPSISRNGDHIVTWFLRKHDEGTYSYDIWLVQSFDNGETWQPPQQLNNDNGGGEHGFADIIPFEDAFLISWLDGRNTVGHHGAHSGAMMVNWALIHSDGSVRTNETLDTRSCDCCHTALSEVSGVPVLAYRDRTVDEIRDIAVSHWQGVGFEEPTLWHQDNWQINGCPVNGPSVWESQGKLAMAWFTQATGVSELRYKVVGAEPTTLSQTTLGRIDSLQHDDYSYISHLHRQPTGRSSVNIIRFNSTTPAESDTLQVADSSASRSSGIPKMAVINRQLWIATTNDRGITLYRSSDALR
ncbi:sialidase family protein [Umboniibacter marinipuniceus]|uniref:Exo-alpha-sialidase n=1 Tax=Umboniibacter marinipuniceus TaxID=569599 RepID=A0A3M0A4P6_9GAMM|nr:sialidase family protein [Umboniibacter marinipuniceus]RMA80013.1 hypothetical protein DFR27_1369 [Umboniibacter marinipuniceus]